MTTEELVQQAISLWGSGSYTTGTTQTEVETQLLRLNWDKAANRLDWHSIYTWKEALAATMAWFKTYHERQESDALDMYDTCVGQITRYTRRARERGLAWAI